MRAGTGPNREMSRTEELGGEEDERGGGGGMEGRRKRNAMQHNALENPKQKEPPA